MFEQKINTILNDCGIDEDDRGPMKFTEAKSGTYCSFDIYDPCVEEMFALGSCLGAEYGDYVWIDTYQETHRTRAVAKLEVLVQPNK